MKTDSFLVEVHEDNIAIITMDVPGETMNTLRSEFGDEVRQVLDFLKSRNDLKGVVFTSGKPDSFIAGADINMLASCETAEDVYKLSRDGHKLLNELASQRLPVVAAIHGPCLGGGLELALACDYRVISNSPKTVLGLPEVQLGILPGGGGTQRLPKLVGIAKSLDLMLTGKQLRPKQAVKLGVADEMVPNTVLIEVAKKHLAKGKRGKVAPKLKGAEKLLEATSAGRNIIYKQALKTVMSKTKGNYPAPEKIIDCVKASSGDLESGLKLEAKHFSELVMSSESEALRSIFFATTEMKKETGAGDVEPKPVKRTMVLGGGLMGGGIANVTAVKAKVPVRIKDIAHEGISKAMSSTWKQLDKKVKRRHILESERDKTMSLLTGTLNYQGAQSIDMVIEAVFEDLKLKHQMVKDVEANCGPDTIFATNTSSLPIGQIAAVAERPEQVIGLHYFSPVEKMPLVEVISHEKTSAQTIATTVKFAKKQGKTPIVVKDCAGFYVNRILAPYMNEAANLLLEGEAIEKLDNSLVNFGFPVGPITLLDEVGIDVGAKISPILEAELGSRFAAPAAFDKLLADGRMGRKNGKGFYRFDSDKKGAKPVDESVYKVLGITPSPRLSDSEIAERCVVQMLNEAARCLDEGIIASARDGDIGAIFGIGFPPFLGGPFRYMDKLGAKQLVAILERYQSLHGDRFEPCERLKAMAAEDLRFYE